MELSSSGGEGVSVARGSGQRTGRGSAGGGGRVHRQHRVFRFPPGPAEPALAPLLRLLQTVSRKGTVAMGTHVQLLCLQKIAISQLGWNTSLLQSKYCLLVRPLSDEVEKEAGGGLGPPERGSLGQGAVS